MCERLNFVLFAFNRTSKRVRFSQFSEFRSEKLIPFLLFGLFALFSRLSWYKNFAFSLLHFIFHWNSMNLYSRSRLWKICCFSIFHFVVYTPDSDSMAWNLSLAAINRNSLIFPCFTFTKYTPETLENKQTWWNPTGSESSINEAWKSSKAFLNFHSTFLSSQQ